MYRKKIYNQQWAICTWDVYDNNHQRHHQKNKHLANNHSHKNQAQNDKIGQGI
jgi:hypothetical protein